jgi:hypothetical protein
MSRSPRTSTRLTLWANSQPPSEQPFPWLSVQLPSPASQKPFLHSPSKMPAALCSACLTDPLPMFFVVSPLPPNLPKMGALVSGISPLLGSLIKTHGLKQCPCAYSKSGPQPGPLPHLSKKMNLFFYSTLTQQSTWNASVDPGCTRITLQQAPFYSLAL